MEWPPDALCTLLKMNVDIASGVYPQHNDRGKLIAGIICKTEKRGFSVSSMDHLRGKIIGGNEFVAAGNGCMLIKRRVFKQYSPHYPSLRFVSEGGFGSDLYFWWTAQKIGFKCRINGNIICGHNPQHPLAEII